MIRLVLYAMCRRSRRRNVHLRWLRMVILNGTVLRLMMLCITTRLHFRTTDTNGLLKKNKNEKFVEFVSHVKIFSSYFHIYRLVLYIRRMRIDNRRHSSTLVVLMFRTVLRVLVTISNANARYYIFTLMRFMRTSMMYYWCRLGCAVIRNKKYFQIVENYFILTHSTI